MQKEPGIERVRYSGVERKYGEPGYSPMHFLLKHKKEQGMS